MDKVEKSAAEMINKLEQVDKEAELVILFDPDKAGRCSEIAHKVKGQHKVFDYRDYYGCECDIVIYITNDIVPPEAISRPRKKLVIISGPDLAYVSQLKLKILASSQHKYTSLLCTGEPCPWSDGWTPLLQHVVFCGNCGNMMGRSSEVCTQCGHKYEESTVLVRAVVRSNLKQIVELINETSATDEEVEDLLGNDKVVNLVKQINDAQENNDGQLAQTLFQQLRALITSISQSEQITEPSAPVTAPSASVTEASAPVTVPSAPVTVPSASDTEASASRVEQKFCDCCVIL